MDVKSTALLHGIEWAISHGHLDYFQKPPLGGKPNTCLGDHGNPNVNDRWYTLVNHVWGPAWIVIHWSSIWLRTQSHMTSHYTWGSMTALHDCEGSDTFLLGSHNFMVMALGSCAKWPSILQLTLILWQWSVHVKTSIFTAWQAANIVGSPSVGRPFFSFFLFLCTLDY